MDLKEKVDLIIDKINNEFICKGLNYVNGIRYYINSIINENGFNEIKISVNSDSTIFENTINLNIVVIDNKVKHIKLSYLYYIISFNRSDSYCEINLAKDYYSLNFNEIVDYENYKFSSFDEDFKFSISLIVDQNQYKMIDLGFHIINQTIGVKIK